MIFAWMTALGTGRTQSAALEQLVFLPDLSNNLCISHMIWSSLQGLTLWCLQS